MPCVDGGPHDGKHDDFGCRVKHFSVDPFSMPSRLTGGAPKRPNPVWERGVPTDSRGMPFLDKTGHPMGNKAFSEQKHAIEDKRRKNHQLQSTAQLTAKEH